MEEFLTVRVQNNAILSRNQSFIVILKHVGLVCGNQPFQHSSFLTQGIVALDARDRTFPKLNTQIVLACCEQSYCLTYMRFVADKEN
jgi:hypothetical protein